jgi:hypothetical protein
MGMAAVWRQACNGTDNGRRPDDDDWCGAVIVSIVAALLTPTPSAEQPMATNRRISCLHVDPAGKDGGERCLASRS